MPTPLVYFYNCLYGIKGWLVWYGMLGSGPPCVALAVSHRTLHVRACIMCACIRAATVSSILYPRFYGEAFSAQVRIWSHLEASAASCILPAS